MAEVLKNPERGAFDEAILLSNPTKGEAETQLYSLFAGKEKDDLLLLYFSGHGVKDENRNLFLTTTESRKENGAIVPISAIKAADMQDWMRNCASERLVVILDCCYSAAFAEGVSAKDDGEYPVQENLGGKGRAILTACDSVQYSFEQKDSELSVYTQYLVEGIRTGAADLDGNGQITAEKLSKYATQKVQEKSPAMTPCFFPVEQGYQIVIAVSPQDDPKLRYRREVQKLVEDDEGDIDFLTGEFDFLCRAVLDELRSQLGISFAEAAIIEAEVIEPLCQRRKKLQQYEALYQKAIAKSNPLKKSDRQKLGKLQKLFGLRDEDVQPSAAKLTPKIQKPEELQEPELKSEKGVDYSTLRDLLKAGEWEKADIETGRRMLEVANREEEEWLELEHIENFPCEDLRTIDRLWVYFSKGHFGFSVQKKIYEELGGTREYDEKIWEGFGDRVGWRRDGKWVNYGNLEFSLKSPGAHLPSWVSVGSWSWVWEGERRCGRFCSLAQRLATCRITASQAIEKS